LISKVLAVFYYYSQPSEVMQNACMYVSVLDTTTHRHQLKVTCLRSSDDNNGFSSNNWHYLY